VTGHADTEYQTLPSVPAAPPPPALSLSAARACPLTASCPGHSSQDSTKSVTRRWLHKSGEWVKWGFGFSSLRDDCSLNYSVNQTPVCRSLRNVRARVYWLYDRDQTAPRAIPTSSPHWNCGGGSRAIFGTMVPPTVCS